MQDRQRTLYGVTWRSSLAVSAIWPVPCRNLSSLHQPEHLDSIRPNIQDESRLRPSHFWDQINLSGVNITERAGRELTW